MSGFVPPPPAAPEPAVAAVEEPVAAMAAVSRADQEMWMRLVERYQKMRAPEFQGSTDPLVADKWKENVSSILSLMGVDRVQRQRLAAFSLKGDAGKWYRAQFTEDERLDTTWEEFVWRFDLQFISSAARAGKESELLALKQGDLSVAAYESKFVSLSHFTDNMFQTEERKARMFERGLKPQIKRYLVSQHFHTLREVADVAITQEVFVSAAKEKEATTETVDKVKGKRPFQGDGQGAPHQQRGQQQ